MRHAEVVLKAGWWLRERQRCCPVLLEPGYGSMSGERPDAIGWRASLGGISAVVECKANRPDFLADRHKFHRKNGRGMGVYRYYMAPKGIVFADEVPEGWGYLEIRGQRGTGRVYRVIEAPARVLPREDLATEHCLLAGALANVQYTRALLGVIHDDGRHTAANLGPNPRKEYWRGYDEGRERERKNVPDWAPGLGPRGG